VVGEEPVRGVEAAGRDPGVGEHLRERVGLADADLPAPGEHRLRGEDRRERERRPVPGRERAVEHGPVVGEPVDHRRVPLGVVRGDRVRAQRVHGHEHDVGDGGVVTRRVRVRR